MSQNILITPRSLTRDGHPALDLLRNAGYALIFSNPGKQPDEEELLGLLPYCIGYLAGVEKISSRVLKSARALRVISRNGTGTDNIDMEAARELNIRVCRAEAANARGVAELTIGLMLALVRSIPFSDARMKHKKWERREGLELEGLTLGIVGCGRVGKQVALLAIGLGMRVVAFDILRDASFSRAERFGYVSLEELLKHSDIVSLHCPPLEDGKPLINKETIGKMKRGIYLINTARANLLDEKAVLEALEKDHIGGLALDVFEIEPPADNPLVQHDRVIATPHIGGYTSQSVSRATRAAVDNLLKYLVRQ